jgi:hypothetical protein
MPLSCDCDNDDPDWWYRANPVAPLATKRSRKCCSCKERIAVGDDAMEFVRWRTPAYESVAERIYGEGGEEPLASWWLCDRCAGLYESLDALGFCIGAGEDMRSLAREYAEMQREAGVFRGELLATAKTN